MIKSFYPNDFVDLLNNRIIRTNFSHIYICKFRKLCIK